MYADTNRYLSYEINKLDDSRLIQIGCSGGLNSCTSLNSLGPIASDVKRSIACENCKLMQSSIYCDEKINVDVYQLLLPQTAYLKRVKKIIEDDKNLSNAINLNYEGIYFCKIAFFDWSILFKLGIDSILTKDQVERFLFGVEDLLKIYQSIIENDVGIENAKYLFYINGNYSQNTFLRSILKKNLTKSISVETQPFTNKIFNKICFKSERVKLDCDGLCDMPQDDSPVDMASLGSVLSNFKSRFYGKEYNAYTNLKKNGEVRAEINKLRAFTEKYNFVCTYFAHSSDEVIPHRITHNSSGEERHDAFKNQEDYLNWLNKVASINPDTGFIIRLHPRMAPNKRDEFESEEHKRIRLILNQGFRAPNIYVITGDAKISSYYVAFRSTIIVVGWSTIGLEALALGARVLSIFPNSGMYPIKKISNQPPFTNDIFKSIKLNSSYCAPVERALAAWLATAYEYQFAQIPVIRTVERLPSMVLYLVNRLIIKFNLNKMWFNFFKFARVGSLKRGGEFLFICDQRICPASNADISKFFKSHRESWIELMKNYEK